MKITKLGHCCLLIEEAGTKILTDPGNYSDSQNTISEIDIVVISHEHADHLHLDSLKSVLHNNPSAVVICNASVGKILDTEGIAHQVIDGTSSATVKGLPIEACDGKHEEIFEEIGQVQNTGYMIAEKLYYPGDSFTAPQKPIEILALPVAGPWCKLPDAIRFALRTMPKRVFPVHDAMLKQPGTIAVIAPNVFGARGIEYTQLNQGESHEF